MVCGARTKVKIQWMHSNRSNGGPTENGRGSVSPGLPEHSLCTGFAIPDTGTIFVEIIYTVYTV